MGAAKSWVEIDPATQLPIRIIRNSVDVWKLPSHLLRQWPKSEAVRSIREQVSARANHECEFCGARLTWGTGHMHEKIPKGNGGEVSLANSVWICSGCHIGPQGEHGNRKWNG